MDNGSTTQEQGLSAILDDARNVAAERRAQDTQLRAKRAQEHRAINQVRDDLIRTALTPARTEEYKGWLKGHLEQGGKLGNVYDYPMPNSFFVATRDIDEFPKLYGAMKVSVIVPEGVKFPIVEGHMPYGHCDIYFMDEFRTSSRTAPLYSDINF